MYLGTPPLPRPSAWLRPETVESIANQGAECLVRAGDGELMPRPQPASGLASRVRSALAELHLIGGGRRTAPATDTEVLAALKDHYRSIDGPEKKFLPRTLVSRNPRAAAQEVLENIQVARQRLHDAGASLDSRQAIERAARALLPHETPDRELHVARITQQAVRFASLRWTDDFIYNRLPPERIHALVGRFAADPVIPAEAGTHARQLLPRLHCAPGSPPSRG